MFNFKMNEISVYMVLILHFGIAQPAELPRFACFFQLHFLLLIICTAWQSKRNFLHSDCLSGCKK